MSFSIEIICDICMYVDTIRQLRTHEHESVLVFGNHKVSLSSQVFVTLFSQFGNYHWSLDLWVTFVLLTSFNVRLLYALGVQEGSFGVTFSPMSSHFSVNVVFFMKKCSRIAHHLSWTSETTLNTDHMHL